MAGLHEVELFNELLENLGGEAFFQGRLLLLPEGGGALGLVIEVAFAPEAAGGEAGKGIEHAEIVEGIGGESLAEGVGAGGQDFGDLGGGDLLDGLEAVDVASLAEEFEGAIGAGAAFLDQAEFAQVVLVATGFPAADVVGCEAFGIVAELLDDFGVGETVVEHLVDAFAEGFGKAGDVAVAGAGIFWIFDF